ncbi:MAG TPA: hypothetical protein VFX22_09230 [Candidatus Kapabacteria bacterium]|nr:hypothetical protein [Candidatus Kapabacteria bacterium]
MENESITIHFPLSTIHYEMTPPKLCGDCGTQMDVNPDLFALPGLDPTPNGLTFNFTRALPATVYICPNCGRFKFISAIFLNNIEPASEPQPAAQSVANEAQEIS